MATCMDSGSEKSESEEELIECDVRQGYLFQPRRDLALSSSSRSSNSENEETSDDPEDEVEGRFGTSVWCKCGTCSCEKLQTEKEHKCCQETKAVLVLLCPMAPIDIQKKL